MQKKFKFENIRIFNQFWLGSCYYHQLYAAASCLGIEDCSNILLLPLNFACGNFETKRFDEIYKDAEELSGFEVKHIELSLEILLNRLSVGYPVLAGVDCFEMPERRDYYQKQHSKHFILVYGYDLERQILNIVDHNYFSDLHFQEKEMSFDKFDNACRSCIKYFASDVKTTGMEVVKLSIYNSEKVKLKIDKNIFRSSFDNIQRDISFLKENFDAKNTRFVADNIGKISSFLYKMQITHEILKGLINRDTYRFLFEEVITAYKFLFAIIGKMQIQQKYDLFFPKRAIVNGKIDTLLHCEQRLFDIIGSYDELPTT